MLTELLTRHATERARDVALVADGHQFTWKELREYAAGLANGLAGFGVERGNAVALLLPNCFGFVGGLLALAELGAVAVPLSIDCTPDEIRSALRSRDCRAILAGDEWSGVCNDLLRERIVQCAFHRKRHVSKPDFADLVDSSRGHHVRSQQDAEFLQLQTSGTTGRPKRIVRTQAQLGRLGEGYGASVGTRSSDRILATAPFSHGQGLCSGLLSFLQSGATLVLQERFDRRQTLRVLTQQQITLFSAVPFVFSILADTRMDASCDLSALRLCFTGAAPLSRRVWNKVRDRLGIVLRQSYGSSETGLLTINMDDNPDATVESVGTPIAGVVVEIRDESGAVVPRESVGEIVVQTPGAASSRCSGAEDDTLRRETLHDRHGWIRTGDLGKLDAQGRLYLVGRRSDLINVAGRKVDPQEIKNVLLDHPKVRDLAIVPLRDAFGEEAVKALVVRREDCTGDELLGFCRDKLAGYKVPRFIEFRNELP